MKDEGPDGHMHGDNDGPLGHMCNINDETPKPGIIDTSTFKKVDDPVVATNLLLGFIVGHLDNLVTESNRANKNASRRHDEWQETLTTLGEIQGKAQRTGAIVICVGICFLSTFISIVISLLI